MAKEQFIIMTIQFLVLFVAIASLSIQQRKAVLNAREVDRRTETKLKLFYLLQEKEMMLDQIIAKYPEVAPLKAPVDDVEIRKSLYEMLKEGTVWFAEDMIYKPRIGKPQADSADH